MSDPDGRTHWETCWREHLDCAVARCDALKAENARLCKAFIPWRCADCRRQATALEQADDLRAALTPKEPSDGKAE